MAAALEDVWPAQTRSLVANQGVHVTNAATALQGPGLTGPVAARGPIGLAVAGLEQAWSGRTAAEATAIQSGGQQTAAATESGLRVIEEGDAREAVRVRDGAGELDRASIESEARERAATINGGGRSPDQAAQVAAQVGAGVLQAGAQGIHQITQQISQVGQQLGQVVQQAGQAGAELMNETRNQADDDSGDELATGGYDAADPGIGSGGLVLGGAGTSGAGGSTPIDTGENSSTPATGVAPVGSPHLTRPQGNNGGVVVPTTGMPMGGAPAAGAQNRSDGVKRGAEIEDTKPVYSGVTPVVEQQIGALPVIEVDRSGGGQDRPPFEAQVVDK